MPFGDGGDKADKEQEQIPEREELSHRDESVVEHGGQVVDCAVENLYQVQNDAQRGKENGREDGHEHIEAGEVQLQNHVFSKRQAVLADNLIKSLRPAQTLIPGLLEVFRLLVVYHRVRAVADFSAAHDRVNRELNVLRQHVEGPAAVFDNRLFVQAEARARNRAAGV